MLVVSNRSSRVGIARQDFRRFRIAGGPCPRCFFFWCLGLLLGPPFGLAQENLATKPPNVFDLPRIRMQQALAHRNASVLIAMKNYEKAEDVLNAAVKRVPHDQTAHYNLACVLARQGKTDKAFAHLESAIDLGWRNRDHLAQDPDLKSLQQDKRFEDLLKAAAGPPPKEVAGWKFSITPAEPKDGQVVVEEDCTAYDSKTGLLRVFFRPPELKDDTPIAKNLGEAGKLLTKWSEAGTAAGNRGDFYDNHDSDHSNMKFVAFPQLTRIEFSEAAKKRGLHHGLQMRFSYNAVTIGNSSTAIVRGSRWRSQGRFALTQPSGPQILARHYLSNHLYFYPEHRDHDAGHNGKEGGYGDVFPANTPYLILSQGSSGSDRAFMNAVAATLAAFRPQVKTKLSQTGLLMPNVQLIFRMSNKQVATPEDYRSGKAHPTVFDGKQIDMVKMVNMAHDMTTETLPPFCQIEMIEEDLGEVGRDYFDSGPREKFFDTPCAIARIVKSMRYEKRLVLSAEKSRDLNGKPLTYHWTVLRGDADRITIKPLNETGSRVELIVPYHQRKPLSKDSPMESNRVDIGVFVHNGAYDSAPAFVSLYYLDNELRTYDDKQRIQSIDYRADAVRNNYVDPLLDTPKDWRDDYHYDKAGKLSGWTRTRADSVQEFTAQGQLILEPAKPNQPAKTTEVRYVTERLPSGKFLLKQKPVNPLNEATR